MTSNRHYADAIAHELEILGEPVSESDRRKIAELTRLFPLFARGTATAAHRKAARSVLHPSWQSMARLRR